MNILENETLLPVYYAGLFDGEGSVGIYWHGVNKLQKYPLVTAKVTNSFGDVLQPLLSRYGGNIENNKASQKQTNWQDTYTWRAYSEKGINFLRWVSPYCIIKKEQIDLTFDFWNMFQETYKNKYVPRDTERIQYYIDNLKSLKRGK